MEDRSMENGIAVRLIHCQESVPVYDSLLLKYKPRPIRNEREHRRALKHVEELIGRHGPTPPRAEGELIAVLSTLIESYEVAMTPRRKPTPAETLEHLIESKEVTRAEVAPPSPTCSPVAAKSAKRT
jgi:antitoxin component HigA of HigAB toxin-antitoxin module